MNDAYKIADLIVRKIEGDLSSVEQQELDQWIAKDPENQSLYDKVCDPKKQIEKLEVYRMFDKEKMWERMEDQLFESRTVNFTQRRVFRFAAAILLPLVVFGGLAYLFLRAPAIDTLAIIDDEFKPGTQKAVLILSDGQSVELGQGESMAELQDGDARIVDENLGLSYLSEARGSQIRKLIFNELKTPRGGGYNLQLADGTKVWLNAGSSIRYPVSFHDSIRQVFLSGEAYFEVNHNGKPFVVSAGEMNTRVLGTSFNVSAYTEDASFKTTLVEGKVRVELMNETKSITASKVLAPNEQATFLRSLAEISTTEVNAADYVSWMQGKLEFHNESLEIVMKKLARWYDFEYAFENEQAKEFHFSARLDREENISTILEMLELTTDVKFAYRENNILVL